TEVIRNTTETSTPRSGARPTGCLSVGRSGSAGEGLPSARSRVSSAPDSVRSATRFVIVVRETPRARERPARWAGPPWIRCPSRRRAVAPGLVLIVLIVVGERSPCGRCVAQGPQSATLGDGDAARLPLCHTKVSG